MPDNINPETQHEKSDVNVRALLMFLVIFIVFAAVTHVVVWAMFKQFASMARHVTSTPLTQIRRPPDASVPQVPRLQPFPTKERTGVMMPPNASTPIVDMEEMRASEEQALNNAGWVDKQKGIVRLPINVAKQLAVQRLGGAGGQR